MFSGGARCLNILRGIPLIVSTVAHFPGEEEWTVSPDCYWLPGRRISNRMRRLKVLNFEGTGKIR